MVITLQNLLACKFLPESGDRTSQGIDVDIWCPVVRCRWTTPAYIDQ